MSSILDETMESWRFAREGVIEEFRNLPANSLGFRPTPESRNTRELAQHVLEATMMFVGELTRPDTNFQRAPYPALIRLHAKGVSAAKTQGELVRLLRSQLKDGEKAFRAAGDLALLHVIKRFDGGPWTRLAMFHHAIAHEEYHRAQLALYARLQGFVPALTQVIQGG